MIRKIIAAKPWGSELDKDAPALPPENALTPDQMGLLPMGSGSPGDEREGSAPSADAPTTPDAFEKPGASASPPAGAAPAAAAVPGVAGAGAAPVGAPAPVEVQKTALNGGQVSAIVDVLKSVQDGTLNPEAAKAALALAFPGYDLEQAGSAIDSAFAVYEKEKVENERKEEEMRKAGLAAAPPPGSPPPPPGANGAAAPPPNGAPAPKKPAPPKE